MEKEEKKRRIVAAAPRFLSLCLEGKNGIKGLYKGSGTEGPLSVDFGHKNQDMEKGLLTAVVYAPGILDEDNEFAEKEVIEAAAHHFLRYGEGVDIYHDGEALPPESASVVESFIIQEGDPRFEDIEGPHGKRLTSKDLAGGWGVVIKIDDPELRQKYREEGWAGISMGGGPYMVVDEEPEMVKAKSSLSLLGQQLAKCFGFVPTKDTTKDIVFCLDIPKKQ